MKYNTMFNTVHSQTFDVPTQSDVVRPDLSFTLKEIQQKFTLHQIIANGNDTTKNYLLSPDSNEFDSPSVNLRQNYDLVDAYADSNRIYHARRDFVNSIRIPKKRTIDTDVQNDVKNSPDN